MTAKTEKSEILEKSQATFNKLAILATKKLESELGVDLGDVVFGWCKEAWKAGFKAALDAYTPQNPPRIS